VVMGILYVGFVAWSLYGAVVPIETHLFRMIHLAFILCARVLAYPFSRKADRWSFGPDLVLALLGVACIVYALTDLDQFIPPLTLPDPWTCFSALRLFCCFWNSRGGWWTTPSPWWSWGSALCLFRSLFPGVLSHRGYEIDRIVGHMTMTLGGRLRGAPLGERFLCAPFCRVWNLYGHSGRRHFWLDLSLATMDAPLPVRVEVPLSLPPARRAASKAAWPQRFPSLPLCGPSCRRRFTRATWLQA